MGMTRIMEAVRQLNRHVRALGSKWSPSAGAATPAGESPLGRVKKTQPKKASMFGTVGASAASTLVASLLAHVNLLLVLYGGASLATAARLKWDPSTYIAVRELLPVEYAATAAGATAGGLMLLLLPHLAAAALLASRPATRRILLLIYAGAMLALVLCELVLGAWLARRLWLWLNSDEAILLFNIIELRKKLSRLLQIFGLFLWAPRHLDHLLKEAEEDVPCNLYVAAAAGALLALLQPAAIALALCEARRALMSRLHSARAPGESKKASLDTRTVYKNKNLVVV